MPRVVHVETDRSFAPHEYAQLICAVHRADPADYPAASVLAALDACHFVAHVRDDAGMLVGTLCAFSDGVFATLVGELVVHPSARGQGVGTALLGAVEAAWPGVPLFALGFRDTGGFFRARGYSEPPRPMEVLTKLTSWPAGPEIALDPIDR